MASTRAAYRAVNPIDFNGVRAYNPGDPVDALVVEGEHAWVDADDVEPVGAIRLDRPADSAGQARWAAYAVQQGMDPAKAEAAPRAELIKAYGK